MAKLVQHVLGWQLYMQSRLMSQFLQHAADSQVRFPRRQIVQPCHILMHLMQLQRVQFCCFCEELSFPATFVVEKPEVLFEVLVTDLLGWVQDVPQIFAVQVVLEGN